MKESLKILLRYIYRYKFFGIWLYFQLYVLKRNKVELPEFGKLILRPGTCDTEIFTQVFIFCQYDFSLTGEVKTIFDLGANNGMSARYFHTRYPTAKIYAVEPDPENYKALLKNISGIDSITPVNKAVWKENGFIRLDDGTSWAVKVDMEGGNKVAEAITLNSLMETYAVNNIDLLKIDIESAEKEVFEADCGFLNSTNNCIVELHDWIKDGCAVAFFRAFKGFQYRFALQGENVLMRDICAVESDR